MTDPVREYLAARNYADHVVKGGLTRLVQNWECVANNVAAGKPQYYYDYLNDMDGRRILHVAMSVAAVQVRSVHAGRVSAADGQIRPHLVAVADCIWGNHVAEKRGYRPDIDWWYYHRPLVIWPGSEDLWPSLASADDVQC